MTSAQVDHRGQQRLDPEPGRHAQRGRVDIVRALRRIDVVVRVELVVAALGKTHVLERAVRDDLVRVHVGRRAGATLDHVDDELVVQLAADQVVAGTHDCGGLRRGDHAELGVGLRCGLLDERERAHQLGHGRNRLPRDREVVDGAGRVNAPVGRERDVFLAEKVVFAAGCWGVHALSFERISTTRRCVAILSDRGQRATVKASQNRRQC